MNPLDTPPQSSRAAAVDWALAFFIGITAAAFRYLTHRGFTNDQFIHLAKAQAWLAGDWPIRDFTDAGAFLTIGASAAVQALFGHALLPELLLSVSAIGLGAALTFRVAAALTGSRTLGMAAAAFQVLLMPRLYGYPKVLIYPAILWLVERYTEHPTRLRRGVMAACVAVAFLIRHDHGVYACIGSVAAIAIAHRLRHQSAARPLAEYGGILAACLLPFAIYVQATSGLFPYLRVGAETSRAEAGRAPAAWPRFRLPAGPLMVQTPARADDLPAINIRWAPGVSEDARNEHERAAGLRFGEPIGVRTWRYRVDDVGAGLRALLAGPDVEDVAGIDRQTLQLLPPIGWVTRLTQSLQRWEPGPPVRAAASRETAATLLFYASWILPALALLVWSVVRRRTTPQSAVAIDARVPALAVLTLVCAYGLLRGDPVVRAPDIGGTLPILIVWLAAVLAARARWFISLSAWAAVVLSVVTATSVGGAAPIQALKLVLGEPATAMAMTSAITRSTVEWPWTAQWPGHEEQQLATYVNRCTRPGDRLLVTWNAPEFYVFSRRPFAGREAVLMPLFRPPSTYERQVLEAWRGQSVPIVLATNDEEFARNYPLLWQYLNERYTRVDHRIWSGELTTDVFVDRTRAPVSRDVDLNLPCFGQS